MAQRTAHILIEGRVQGVGFRNWVEQQAANRSLTGWVRNRRTGAVEAVLSGNDAEVGAMIEACRRGPPAARVDSLYEISGAADDSSDTFVAFEVRNTI